MVLTTSQDAISARAPVHHSTGRLLHRSQGGLSRYANETVRVGAPMKEAVERLNSGFACEPRVSAPATSCTRLREAFLYSCIERINIRPSADATLVGSAVVPTIACAGL
jgi:hypothetical protein